ncbi:M15 family metallopeptidase [Hahella aquimaris]|uniref:M15 family metallopeptidase n=1 Tax=Hahella sp. HNIBRBA332 TaxID=3015983 RepID=UPI00273C94CE|nr:M15 family metallopeptidase [Hahella sp. HNIBRBA332]WLQ15414.1 M15 family metallopeptidase [Hahella sp. HNIBRBA332]
MSFYLGKRSKSRLVGLHPDLVKVVERAIQITPIDFTVLEGLRTTECQTELYKAGKSKTMRSRHLTGHAVDLGVLINGSITWETRYYQILADAVKQAAEELGIPIEWGGDFNGFFDGPHYQLPWKEYP